MFSRKFANDATNAIHHHRAIHFLPNQGTTNEEIIKQIQKQGIAKYCQPDSFDSKYQAHIFNDGRFAQYSFKIQTFAGCCSFTKTAGNFYLFPIHKTDLASVGLVEEDLLLWIKKFNDLKVGFNYLYFGEQPAPEVTGMKEVSNWMAPHYNSKEENIFYWVGVPVVDPNSRLIPYLHWVTLRYLWNARQSGNNSYRIFGASSDKEMLGYYNIPRVTMMFHEDYKVPFLKAFLYAHIVHPWCFGNSLAYSDYMGLSGMLDQGNGRDPVPYDYKKSLYQAPCVDLKRSQFKELWANYPGGLNTMLTEHGVTVMSKSELITTTTKAVVGDLAAPYDPRLLHTLFDEGKYDEVIKHIKDSYKKHKEAKKEAKPNETVSA